MKAPVNNAYTGAKVYRNELTSNNGMSYISTTSGSYARTHTKFCPHSTLVPWGTHSDNEEAS